MIVMPTLGLAGGDAKTIYDITAGTYVYDDGMDTTTWRGYGIAALFGGSQMGDMTPTAFAGTTIRAIFWDQFGTIYLQADGGLTSGLVTGITIGATLYTGFTFNNFSGVYSQWSKGIGSDPFPVDGAHINMVLTP